MDKRCPFCPNESGSIHPVNIPRQGVAVRCMDCGCTGPACETEAKAREAWNRRTLPPSTGAPDLRQTIPENILRAADAIVAYPEAYQGYPLIVAKYLRDSWPALPLQPAGDLREAVAKEVLRFAQEPGEEWASVNQALYLEEADRILTLLPSVPAQPGAAALIWTREKPTREGWYFTRVLGQSDNSGMEAVLVSMSDRHGAQWWSVTDEAWCYPQITWEWAGPILEPGAPGGSTQGGGGAEAVIRNYRKATFAALKALDEAVKAQLQQALCVDSEYCTEREESKAAGGDREPSPKTGRDAGASGGDKP